MYNKIIVSFAATLALSSSAFADDFIGVNFHVLSAPESGKVTVTGEYSWSKGKFGGYGFIDVFSEGTLEYLTEHSVDYSLTDHFYLSTEVGQSNFGNAVRFGAGVRLPLPGMQYASVTLYPLTAGSAGEPEQIAISWATKELCLGRSFSIYHSGFADIPKNAPVVYQPQVWLKHDKFKRMEIGYEMAMSGDSRAHQIAVKWNF